MKYSVIVASALLLLAVSGFCSAVTSVHAGSGVTVAVFDGLDWDVATAFVGIIIYFIAENPEMKNLGLVLAAIGLFVHFSSG